MEFRNLLSGVSSELLDDYADPHNAQQYWIDNIGANTDFIVYKGSFSNKKRKVMTGSSGSELSFYIDGIKIAEYKKQSCLCSCWSNEYKLYATESFDNVSLRRYDLVKPHSSRLMLSENVEETYPISDVTVKSLSCWKKIAVVANPYFKSVKSYKDSYKTLLIILQLLFISLGLLYSAYVIVCRTFDFTDYSDYSDGIQIIIFLLGMVPILMLFYGVFGFSRKRGKREVFLELVGIDDESPYATINFRWGSPCLTRKPYEIICHRDIDLKQLLTLVAVSVNSIYLHP